jgi:hypothetical protein
LGQVGKINEIWLLNFCVFFTLNMQEAFQISVYYILLQQANINRKGHKFKVSSISIHQNFEQGSGSHQASFAMGTGILFWG